MEQPKIQTLVLGVGSTLMPDEGIGVHVVERLVAEYSLPEEVQVLDGERWEWNSSIIWWMN
jgi:hydrogenase maturation protease